MSWPAGGRLDHVADDIEWRWSGWVRHPRLMEITRFTADDTDAVTQWVELTNAAAQVDSPWTHPWTLAGATGHFRHGWDGEVDVPFLARHDGVLVGVGTYGASEYDNLHLAHVDVTVHPDHRRQGHGSVIFEAMVEQVRGIGRRTVMVGAWESDPARAFATRHGLEQKAAEIERRQVLTKLDRDQLDLLYDEALPRAKDYDLLRWTVPTSEDDLAAIAEMAGSINDAPTDDLDIEDEVYSAERMRGYENAMAGRDLHLYRVIARHRGAGELAGQSVVAVEAERPEVGEQHDTTVVAAHRGHRLGLLLKLEMLRWLQEAEPRLESVDTWNAESNDFMIGVNEAMGYRWMGRVLEFQRALIPDG